MQTQILNFFSDLLYNYPQIELIPILILVIEMLYLPVFLVTIFYHMSKRKGAKPDGNILNLARICSLLGVAGSAFVKSRGWDFSTSVLLWQPFMFLFFAGGRYYVLSFRVKEDKEGTFYHKIDQWLENVYFKYLEPLLSLIK